ncbi:MAG: histidine kinase dimerization/phospho-acceptor domain-containing protein [Porticoccus sp.]|nr:histidine kinase dimerization/phospho-acceptor domain-containing protein [Porticoccus sp.]
MMQKNHQAEMTTAPDSLLKVYSYYRALLSSTLLIMWLIGMGFNVLGSAYPQLYSVTTSIYVVLCLLTLPHFHLNRSSPNIQLLFFILLTDMVATTLIMHASGGLSSGLGFLMLIIVAAGSILLSGRWSLLIAAIASLCVLTETLSSTFLFSNNEEVIFPAGILGILFFVTALVFQVLTRRIREAQSIASQRTVESARLQTLNESIVKRMRTGIIVVDGQDHIQLINSAAIQLLYSQKQDLPLNIGQSLRTIHPLFKQLERWRTYPWLRTPTFKTTTSSRELQANFTSLYNEEDRHVLIFLEDTRALAQHAQQLKLSSLGRLTGSIAHEVRNPLGAISHASQLLSEQSENETQTKLLDIIHRHCGRVNQIVENVLQLSRQKPPAFQKLWLLQWLKKFRHEYLEDHNADGMIEIESTGQDTQIFFDPSHLSQILVNLVDNGLRYSELQMEQRWVKLVISKDTSSELPFLEIYDKGPGIPHKDQENIFEPFFTTSNEGSGLGLYLAQELCAVNYASLSYVGETQKKRCFRIGFAHPERLLPRPQ